MPVDRIGKIWIGVGIASLFVSSAGFYFYQQRKKPQPVVQVVAPPPPVATEVSLSGRVQARNIVAVPAPIEGILDATDVIDGQEVFTGQLLARIQNSELQEKQDLARLDLERIQNRVNTLESQLIAARLEASRTEAEASNVKTRFNQAEKNFQRQEMLLREGATPRLTYEKAQSEYQALKVENDALSALARQSSSSVEIIMKNLDEARRQLSEKNDDLDDVDQQVLSTEVHSPVDGILVAHRVGAGGTVTFEMKDLFQIAVNPGELQVIVDIQNVQPELVSKISVGQPAQVLLVEAGNQPVEGIVDAVESGQVTVNFNTPDPSIRPGFTAQVRIHFIPEEFPVK